MDSTDFEKISSQLADVATKKAGIGDFLGSDAGRYLIGGGLGAGAGAILGAAQPDRAKKKRNMMYYGTLGGLGGLGLAHVLNQHNAAQAAKMPKPLPPPPGPPPADPGTGEKIKEPTLPAAPSAVPARVADSVTAPDVGYDASLSDYENWKLNPKWGNRLSLDAWQPGTWLPGGREGTFRNQFAAEQAAAKGQYEKAVADSLKVPFTKRPSLREMREQYMPAPVNPLQAYKKYNLKDPETLELIRRARSHGMGNDIPGFLQKLKEQKEQIRGMEGSM
jgi:hypothetical protein